MVIRNRCRVIFRAAESDITGTVEALQAIIGPDPHIAGLILLGRSSFIGCQSPGSAVVGKRILFDVLAMQLPG